MEHLRKIAATLAAHGQHQLAREVAEVSLQVKTAKRMTADDWLDEFLPVASHVESAYFEALEFQAKVRRFESTRDVQVLTSDGDSKLKQLIALTKAADGLADEVRGELQDFQPVPDRYDY